MLEKEHHKLLRDIRIYIDYLGRPSENLGESNFGLSDFFIESTYKSEQNKDLPNYLITRKGCELIAHKFTGPKGVQFSAWYINQFHEMKDIIENKEPRKKVIKIPEGVELAPLPTSNKIQLKPADMLTATQVGELLGGICRAKIGKIATRNHLKTLENGYWIRSIAPGNEKPVDTFIYYKSAVEKFKPFIIKA